MPSLTATLRGMKVKTHFTLPEDYPNAGPAAYNAAKQIGATIRTKNTGKGLLVMLATKPTKQKNEKTFRVSDSPVEFSGRGRPTLAAAAKAKAGKKAPAKAAKPAKKAAPNKSKAKVAKTAKPKTRKLNATEAANAAAAL